LGPDTVSRPLAEALLTAASASNAAVAVPRLLKLLELAHPSAAAPAVRRALSRAGTVDVLASCVRALADPHDRELACAYAAHPAWQVRVAAAIALRRFAAPLDRKLLIDMLADPHWWVRRSAADTLLALPFVNVEDLQKIQRVLPDRYAAEMLQQAIAERAA
jgi:HEAT repeat protein